MWRREGLDKSGNSEEGVVSVFKVERINEQGKALGVASRLNTLHC
jgi:hypothetical protein